jgi:isoquinoline 1-oxidoreductase beta subunit
VKYALAPAGAEYAHTMFGMQMTGGSSSVVNSWDQLRTGGRAGAHDAHAGGAKQWKVNPSQVRAENGAILGPAASARLRRARRRGREAAGAGRREAEGPASFKLIGKPTRRIDSAEKTDGSAVFGMDLQAQGPPHRDDRAPAGVRRPSKSFGATR